MVTEEQKWMNRLIRCIKDIPEGTELLVDSVNSESSSVTLLNKGGFCRSLEVNGGDCVGIDWRGELITSCKILHNVIANSESY